MNKVLQARLFTREECETIIKFSTQYQNFIVTPLSSLKKDTRTVYAENLDKTWGKSYNVWDIPILEDTKWMYDRIYSWFTQQTGISLLYNSNAHKLHQYTVGDKFSKHVDNFGYPDRLWNVGIQLNDSYIGGEYIIYQDSNSTYLSKEVGNVVAYTADILHEITEITEGERWSMVIKIHDWEVLTKKKSTLL